jgi:WD40 repeat-containing protein SMU1
LRSCFLQKETNVSLNILDNRDAFLDHVRSGRWDLVLPELTSLKLPKSKLEDLYEQIVLEMIELREIDTARVILRQAQVFSQMQTEDPERFIRLERLCSRTIIDVKDLYAGIGCEKRRMSIALALANELVAVPPSRLLVLIGQALKWQRQEGLLSPGGSIDLLRGAASKEMPEEDSLVSKVNVTIKFGAKNYPECATFSPDGKSLVTGSLDGFIEVWDPLSGGLRKDLPYQAEEKLMMHEASVLCLTFSSDGGILVSGDQDGILKIWKFGTGQCLRRFESAHSRGITSVTLSHDNSHILSTSYDSLIRVHGVKSGKMLKEFRGHTSYVNSAIYASDGSMVISASSDATLRIWNVKNCECELVIRWVDQ